MTQATILSIALLSALVGLSACDGENSNTLNGDDSIADATDSENTSVPDANSPDTNAPDTNAPDTNAPDATGTVDPTKTELDGRWLSNCVTGNFPQDPIQFEQEYIVVEGSAYKRTINYYLDSDCSVPAGISFLSVSSTDLQYLGSSVQTAQGSAMQIAFTPTIDFDRRLLTVDEAGLYDPALYFYEFYFLGLDGLMYFGSMGTFPPDQFEQTLDSPHIFSAQ